MKRIQTISLALLLSTLLSATQQLHAVYSLEMLVQFAARNAEDIAKLSLDEKTNLRRALIRQYQYEANGTMPWRKANSKDLTTKLSIVTKQIRKQERRNYLAMLLATLTAIYIPSEVNLAQQDAKTIRSFGVVGLICLLPTLLYKEGMFSRVPSSLTVKKATASMSYSQALEYRRSLASDLYSYTRNIPTNNRLIECLVKLAADFEAGSWPQKIMAARIARTALIGALGAYALYYKFWKKSEPAAVEVALDAPSDETQAASEQPL